MLYWNPLQDTTQEWEPVGGWNASFSEQDKIQCTHLFFFFQNKKGCSAKVANVFAHMVLFKQKYSGLYYSEEQERILKEVLQPVFSS